MSLDGRPALLQMRGSSYGYETNKPWIETEVKPHVNGVRSFYDIESFKLYRNADSWFFYDEFNVKVTIPPEMVDDVLRQLQEDDVSLREALKDVREQYYE